MGALDGFSAATREWFERTFAAPTPAQEEGWAAIRRGDHTLIHAPTGSGKTLAAFLWALDTLLRSPRPVDPRRRCRVLYVSPLKALTYDVERNLQVPLSGISEGSEGSEESGGEQEITVGTRTGDTPAAARRAIARTPPDILATTPESLYLMLTSSARDALVGVTWVIVDEIHAVAGTKRGAHLALSLERLDRLVAQRGGTQVPQRIGLSATQRPLDDIARFLGGPRRPVSVVDASRPPALDLEIIAPVVDLGAPGDVWPSIHPLLVKLIRAHRSTLVFVNSRAVAERLAHRLNEEAGEELVRAHHGSIAHAQRVEIEESLKAGQVPCLVATSSLELGIDMGAIDLVVQVQAPASVASGLQRIGRAGHAVGEPSKGRIVPRFRGDLVVAAVIALRMRTGAIEATQVPRNPLDILAQQVVAMVAVEEGISVDDLYATVTGAGPFSDLTRQSFEGVLDMLAGRYPSTEFGELRPRILWDRPTGELRPRPGAQMLAVTSGGTIPDRGLYAMYTHDGLRVGELDEEMVHETRPGQVVVLGASSWRVDDIDRNRVIVTPAPGEPGLLPFWRGDVVGRPYELGRAIGAFLREVDEWSDERLRAECGMDAAAVANLRAYLAQERAATGGFLPTDRTVVVERFQDELGDWRLCVLSPFGAAVHAPWALAVEEVLRRRHRLEVQALWSDDGIVFRLPEVDDPPGADVVVLDPADVSELVVEALATSSLFSSRFRENAARSLLLPRRRPGQRTPMWLQHQRAADLQMVASRYGEFPVLLETYRECLQDVFDLPGLQTVLGDIATGEIEVVAVDALTPSPFAGALVWSYVHHFVFESDAPVAERRAQALTLDRRMLAELLGTDELRDLLDPGVLARAEAELQGLDERRRAHTPEAAHDLLRRVGDLTPGELAVRSDGPAPGALAVEIAGETRLIAPEDAGRYHDALGVQLPDDVPAAFTEHVPDALEQLVARYARTHGPFLVTEVADRFDIMEAAVAEVLVTMAGAGRVVQGGFRPDGTEPEWCDAGVLRMLRQRSLAAYRKEVEPTEPEALARFLPRWHGVRAGVGAGGDVGVGAGGDVGGGGGGLDRLRDIVAQLEGVPIPASVLERDVLPVRMAGYAPKLLDDLCASGEVAWLGAGAVGRADGKVVLFRRGSPLLDLIGSALAPAEADRPEGEEHERVRRVLAERGAAFFPELRGGDDRASLDALWDLVWAGEVTNDSLAPLRALGTVPKRRAPATARGRARLGTLTVAGPPAAQGRWSLVPRTLESLASGNRTPTTPESRTHAATMLAEVLLDRYGVLTREAVRAEGVPGGFAAVYPVLRAMEESGRARRGYFVAGLGGAQFAVPGAVDRLRRAADRPEPNRHRIPAGSGGSPAPVQEGDGAVVLAATDPANPYGAALAWPAEAAGRAQRVAGAYVVLLDGSASLYVERGGRGLLPLRPTDGAWEADAVAALGGLLGPGRLSRLVVARAGPALEPYLHAAGYVPTPKGWTLYARGT